MESKGSKAAKDICHRMQELEAKASVGFSMDKVIEQVQKQHSTNEGRRTRQKLLSAAVFRGDEEGTSPKSVKRKAGAIGIREHTLNLAVDRVKRLKADLHPAEAITRGVYWFCPRAKSSDAADDELVLLMRQNGTRTRSRARPATWPTVTCGRRPSLLPLSAIVGGSSSKRAGTMRCTRSSSSQRATGASSRGRAPTSLTLAERSSSRPGESA